REELLQSPPTAEGQVRAFPRLEIIAASEDDPRAVVFPLRAPEPVERDMAKLGASVRDGSPTLILCDNSGQAERLEELLETAKGGEGTRERLTLAIGVLAGGFLLPPRGPQGLRVLTDHEIFRRERRIRRARRYATGAALEHVT